MSSKNSRTIIQNARSLRHYDFERLNCTSIQAIYEIHRMRSNETRVQKFGILLKLFECYLQITNQEFILPDTVNTKFNYTIELFVGALWSNKFFNAKVSQRYELTKLLMQLLDELKLIPFLFINLSSLMKDEIKNYSEHHVALFENTKLDEERVYYWQGWWTYNKTNTRWGEFRKSPKMRNLKLYKNKICTLFYKFRLYSLLLCRVMTLT